MQGEQISASRDDLPGLYEEILRQNPLLARLEGTLRSIGWSDTEIRTYQLLAACASNASLKAALEGKQVINNPQALEGGIPR